jgi:hypothetical protein
LTIWHPITRFDLSLITDRRDNCERRSLIEPFFSGSAIHRQVLLWVIAARRQLDRWEILVADIVSSPPAKPDGKTVWAAETERHLALVALHHVTTAARLADLDQSIDPTLDDDLKSLRDLNEHWDENQPIFNVHPRPAEPSRKSGRRFTENHPDDSPYGAFAWASDRGPLLMPSLPAAQVHDLLDSLTAEIVKIQPLLSEYVPDRPVSPWMGETAGRDRWWPRPRDPVVN